MISARATANVIAAGVVAAAATLYRFSPQEYSFYPRCPFFALTGHYCPGCGGTRATAELLHGHLAPALHFNAAVTLLLPFAIAYFGMIYWTASRHNRFEWPSVPSWSWKLAVALLAVFGFARMFTEGTL
jgi:Protein of unknown function (DUF2752)